MWLEEWKASRGNWFDLIASCFAQICAKGSNRPRFISTFANARYQESAGVENFVNAISDIVDEHPILLRDDFEAVFEEIEHLCDSFLEEAPPSWDSVEEIACFAIVKGIDDVFSDRMYAQNAKNMGPLNRLNTESVGVYYKAPDSVLKGILAAFGIMRSPEGCLSEQLQAFDLVQKDESIPLPKIKRLPSSLVDFRPSTTNTSSSIRLRIGIAAGTREQLFASNDKDKINYFVDSGGALSFEYPSAYIERYDELVGRSLKRAIDFGCEIVVFPELIMPQAYIEQMRKQLQSLPDNKSNRSLQLVIAGSGWEVNPEDHSEKNVCQILDRTGRVQSRTTKENPFILDSADPPIIEHLDSPDHEIGLLDLFGFGRLMVAICKDLETDTLYAPKLATAFSPDLLCVPAASNSVRGAFHGPAQHIATRSHSICCVSNLCSMVKYASDRAPISYVAAPSIRDPHGHHGRFPDSSDVELCRGEEDCSLCCEAKDGCLFVLDIEYDRSFGEGALPTISLATRRA